jgi:hypothetical protein
MWLFSGVMSRSASSLEPISLVVYCVESHGARRSRLFVLGFILAADVVFVNIAELLSSNLFTFSVWANRFTLNDDMLVFHVNDS